MKQAKILNKKTTNKYTVVSLATVENKILLALESIQKQSNKDEVWEKIYHALEQIRKASYSDYYPDA